MRRFPILPQTSRARAATSLAGAFLLLLPGCVVGGGGGSGPVPVRGTSPPAGREEGGTHEGGRPARVQVMMPDERVPCPFEALGTVTVRGPFVLNTDENEASSSELLTGIRAKLGAEAAEMGADEALVRHLLYDRRGPSSMRRSDVRAVEAVLLRFVGADCMLASG